ncbi:MAG: NUDIX hydrolase [Kiritimatiellia bacterium]|nr:NUDIX hydrolase [Kiritimatiellia bacterium]
MTNPHEPTLEPWITLSRRTILPGNRFLSVEEHTIRLPDGRIIDDWPWILTPDFILIAAIDEESRFLCFRQTKYAVQGPTLAPVGGFLEPGEEPAAAALRELHEETGYEADHAIPLGTFATDANRGGGTAHLFYATGARKVCEPHADDLEEQHLIRLTRNEVRAALDRNEFKVLAWAAVMEMTLRKTENSPA